MQYLVRRLLSSPPRSRVLRWDNASGVKRSLKMAPSSAERSGKGAIWLAGWASKIIFCERRRAAYGMKRPDVDIERSKEGKLQFSEAKEQGMGPGTGIRFSLVRGSRGVFRLICRLRAVVVSMFQLQRPELHWFLRIPLASEESRFLSYPTATQEISMLRATRTDESRINVCGLSGRWGGKISEGL